MTDVLVEYRMEMGKRIKQARTDSGLSHDRLAALCGTSRQHLIKLEKGSHLPRPDLLARYADATGKPLEWFQQPPGGDRAPASPAAA